MASRFASRADPEEVADAPAEASLGRYVRVQKLGAGAAGEVWKAWDRDLKRWVALKLLKGDDPTLLARFDREAKLAAGFTHPNLVSVHEAGRIGDQPFIAFQFVEGTTLDRVSGDDLRRSVRLVRDAARGIQFAHERGVIHRDLKPQNILAAAGEDRALVLDFGLARAPSELLSLSLRGETLGTPAYMSPEQVVGRRETDARTDVYGLGATLYHLVARRPPFSGASVPDILHRILHEEATSPARIRPEVPPDLETIVLKALRKEPERRYPTAAAFADDLDRWLRGEAILARPPSWSERAGKWVRRRAPIGAAAAFSAAVALVLFAIFVAIPRQREREADRKVLRSRSAARETALRDFEAALAEGAHSRAIDIARTLRSMEEAPAGLRHPDVASEAEFVFAGPSADVVLPRAFLARGRARLATGDAGGRTDLASAFLLGRGHPGSREVSCAAIVEIAGVLLREGDVALALATARTAAARFGIDSGEVRRILAAAHQAAGDLEEAASYWHSLRNDPVHGAEAAPSLDLLDCFLPRTRHPLRRPLWALSDLDGDGTLEGVEVGPDNGVVVVRLTEAGWEERGTLVLPPPFKIGWISLVDLDGDGRQELLAGSETEGRFKLSALAWDGGALKLIHEKTLSNLRPVGGPLRLREGGTLVYFSTPGGDRKIHFIPWKGEAFGEPFSWSLDCDVQFIKPLPEGRVLLWLGPWRKDRPAVGWRPGGSEVALPENTGSPKPWGFRLVVLGPDADGVYREIAGSEDRFGNGAAVWIEPGEIVLLSSGAWGQSRVLPELKAGLFRVAWDGREFGRAEALTDLSPGWPNLALTVKGRRRLLMRGDRGLLHAVPLDRERDGVTTIGLPAIGAVSRSAERPLFASMTAEEVVLLGGGRPFAPPPLRSPERWAGTDVGADELLAAGLFLESAAGCEEILRQREDPNVRYQLGRALMELGRWKEAAEAFEKARADPALAVPARLRRARALEQVGDWPEVVRILEAILASPGTDRIEREEARQRLQWARDAANFSPRESWSGGPIACDNPFKTRMDSSGLTLWGAADTGQDAAGALLRYEGGGLRVTFRFTAGSLEWAAPASLGLQRLDIGPNGTQRNESSTLAVGFCPIGARDQPIVRTAFHAWGRGISPRGPLVDRDRPLVPGETYSLEIEYLDGHQRARFVLRDSAGKDACPPSAFDLNFPLERGTYLIGRVAGRWSIHERDTTRSSLQLLGFSVEATEPGSGRPATSMPEGPGEWLVAANGLLVSGRLVEAERAYVKSLERAPADPEWTARVLTFRSLARLRMGDEERAFEGIAEADRLAPGFVRRLLSEAPAAEDDVRRLRERLHGGH